jgi:broad specificity phosphatase PhoE
MDTMGLSAMQIIVDNALQELGHGPWEGRPYNELYTDEALARMRLLGKDFKFEGGESMNDAAARGFDWLEREAPYETEIPEQYFAFTHGTLMKTMVGHILGWERQVIYEKKINNTGAVLLRGRGRDWNIIYDGVDPTDLRLPSLL